MASRIGRSYHLPAALAALLVLAVAAQSQANRQSVRDPVGDLTSPAAHCLADDDIRKASATHAKRGRILKHTIKLAGPVTSGINSGQPPVIFINTRGANRFDAVDWSLNGTRTYEYAIGEPGIFTARGRRVGQLAIYRVKEGKGKVVLGFKPTDIGSPKRYGWVAVIGCGTKADEVDAAPNAGYREHRTG